MLHPSIISPNLQTPCLSSNSHSQFGKPSPWLLSSLIFALLVVPSIAHAQVAGGLELVEVNWIEEIRQGGVTIVALGILSIAMLAFSLERLLTLRRKNIVPVGLARRVLPLFHSGQYAEILNQCAKEKSTLSRVIGVLVSQREDEPHLLAQSAADTGARELGRQEQKNIPLAVIATLAPLLGLLGTMIGMIESFKLVEVFGDEGGASMLAGSISKALITTAVGLILAIPAISLYNFFRYRLHNLGTLLEEDTELLFNAWFKRRPSAVAEVPDQYHAAPAADEDYQAEYSQEPSEA